VRIRRNPASNKTMLARVRGLPAGYRPYHLIPRAYCLSLLAPACAAFAIPPMDGGVIYDDPMRWGGHTLSGDDLVYTPQTGEWVTLVFATSKGVGRWFCLKPMVNPWQRAARAVLAGGK
jgi:hypothetical protein